MMLLSGSLSEVRSSCIDNHLHRGGEADEVNKTLHVEALHMELAEHSLLAVDVADRACVMCKLLLPLLP